MTVDERALVHRWIRASGVLAACTLCLGHAANVVARDLPTAEQVFARHTQAIGGSEAIAQIKNMTAEFTYSVPSLGVSARGTAFVEYPGRSYSSVDFESENGSDFASGTSGDIAWQMDPERGVRLLQGDERRIALHAARVDSFERWSELWDKAETVAQVTIGASLCYQVLLSSFDGQPLSAFFARDSGLLIREDLPVPAIGGVVTTTFRDFREVGGVVTAHRIEQEGWMPFTIVYTSVRYNVADLPTDVFQVPEELQQPSVTP